jgi:hypothetical protein
VLQLFREGDQIVMTGGKWGPHSLSTKVSSAERLLTHWKGYVENQGLSLGPDYGRTAMPRSVSQGAADYQPGDRITFQSPSAHKGWRAGTVVRATPKRVLVEYSYKYDFEKARKTKQPPHRHQIWKKRSEVRRR